MKDWPYSAGDRVLATLVTNDTSKGRWDRTKTPIIGLFGLTDEGRQVVIDDACHVWRAERMVSMELIEESA